MFHKAKHRHSVTKRMWFAASSAATLGAVAMLGASASFGLFSSKTATVTNVVTTGTVSLTSGVTGACNVSNMLPGSSPAPCTLTATYSGNVSAYLGLDVLIETEAGSGGTNLYNPSDSANDLQVSIKDNQSSPVTYTVPGGTGFTGGTCPAGYMCYQLSDELVSATAFTSSSPALTFTTTVSMPSSSPTGYQGASAKIVLTAHAVQARNNSSFISGCTVGQSCGVAGNWS